MAELVGCSEVIFRHMVLLIIAATTLAIPAIIISGGVELPGLGLRPPRSTGACAAGCPEHQP
jgi:hypothetical protein